VTASNVTVRPFEKTRRPRPPLGVPRQSAALLVRQLPAALLLIALSACAANAVAAEDDNDGDAQAAPAATEPRGFPRTPSEIADAMGYPFVTIFVGASIIAVWFAIERLVVLRRARVIPRPFVERFLDHLQQGRLDRAEALSLCEENGSPTAQIFAHGVRKWGKSSVEVEQAIIDGGERQISQLRKHLRVLNGVATVTPLVGLLGTVIGMIQSFIAIEATAGNAGAEQKLELAVGIAMALLTTAAGLAIAIPSLILYLFLAGRVDALVMDMDDLGQNVVHLISAEGLAEAASQPQDKESSTPPPPKGLNKNQPGAAAKAS